MGMNDFVDSIDLLHRALDVQSLRYQVSANSIANSEVPNYKRQTVNFESELKRAVESQKNDNSSFHMITTDSKHIQSNQPRDWRQVEPRRVVDFSSTSKPNGNNVDAEEEAVELTKIQMQYQLLVRLESFEFSQVNIAMKKFS